jgi:phage gpG-like protein
VRGIPYGAIHEFGGTITAKKAKHLWVKVDHKGKFKRLTPREFFELRRKEQTRARAKTTGRGGGRRGKRYDIFRSKKGNLIAAEIDQLKSGNKIRPLFVLKKSVNIPARPYIQPAIAAAVKDWPKLMARELRRILKSRFFK